MTNIAEIQRLLRQQLGDPHSSFSIGSLGAIAEFHRDVGEPLILDDPERLTIATERGGLRITTNENVLALAYETLSRQADRWRHGIVFCCSKSLAPSHRRAVLTELGPDRDPIRAEDGDAVLFDMGLEARNVDFCIRTRDPDLLALLRKYAGRRVLEPGNHAMSATIDASPHRIAISGLGRLEVYQPIDRHETPAGPHTHVLPTLLDSGRTHAANIPVPGDFLPCLTVYPAHPLFDGLGRDKPFERASFDSFQSLLETWGVAEYCAEKARAVEALRRGLDPKAYVCPQTRLGRTALRVAVRQIRQTDVNNPMLHQWLDRFDSAAAVSDEEDGPED